MRHDLVPAAEPWIIDAQASLPQGSLRRIAAVTLLVLVLGFGGLTGWASIAEIESAVPATGSIVSGGKRKTVSLIDSGILRELLVHEGDRVSAGQVLLRLDDVQARTARAQANIQFWSATARAARLDAEAANERSLPVTPELRAIADANPAIAAAVAAEAGQFVNRWAAVDAAVHVQELKIAQYQAQIVALRAQIAAAGTRLSLLEEELLTVDYLMAKGLTTKPRQLELRRTVADIKGNLALLGGQHHEAEQAIAQVKGEIVSNAEARRSDIAKDRADTQAARSDAEQRLTAASDLLQRRDVFAPEDGTVTDIKFFTPGSSIVAGQPVLDLVPASANLLVEATVPPREVEHLAVGQRVNVRLSAYKAHRVPVLPAHLVYVGADRQMDANNQPVFLVRAELEPDALRNRPGVVLLPGMPADVMIVNGARSVLDFLISPITDSMQHAMREE